MARITTPGALILLTVEGAASWNRTCQLAQGPGDDPERWRTELEGRGILVISQDQFIGSTHPDSYHSTVHAPWYVFEHWTRYLDLVTYSVNGSISQDLVVMRHRPDGSPQPRPIRHRPRVDDVTQPAGRAADEEPRADTEAPASSRELDPEAVTRELSMLRAGLYEQGTRISVVAAQLREEIASARAQPEPGRPRSAETVASGRRWLGRISRLYRVRRGAATRRPPPPLI